MQFCYSIHSQLYKQFHFGRVSEREHCFKLGLSTSEVDTQSDNLVNFIYFIYFLNSFFQFLFSISINLSLAGSKNRKLNCSGLNNFFKIIATCNSLSHSLEIDVFS